MKRKLCLALTLLFVLMIHSGLADEAHITQYSHGDRTQNKIAITIDDWNQPDLLPEFLDLAKEYNCKLTLYPVGKNLHEKHRELWQRAIDEGHEIGNHTNTHASLDKLPKERILRQLANMEANLNKALGYEYTVNTLRYPYGNGRYKGLRSAFAATIAEAGYIHSVLWDVDGTDNKTILNRVQNGSIVLFHSNKKDLRILKKVLPKLSEKGYEMVTVSELLNLTKTSPAPGTGTFAD